MDETYLSGRFASDAPFGSCRFGRDDDVAFHCDCRQSDDIVESEEAHTERVHIAALKEKLV